MGGSGMVDPRVFEYVGLDPEEWSGLRLRLRPRADRPAPPRHPRHPPALGERPPRPEAVLMRVPVSWLREYVAFDDAARGARRRGWRSRPPRSSGIERRGVPDTDGNLGLFRVGRVRRGGQAPERRPAPALPRRRGRGASRARSSAAPGTSAPARRSRSRCPARCSRTGSSSSGASCAASVSDGMILAERRARARPRPLAGSSCSPEAASPGRRSPTCCRSRDDVLEVEATGNRPDLLAVYGIAREVAALFDRRARAVPRPRARRARRRAGRHRRSRTSRAARATSAGSSAT